MLKISDSKSNRNQHYLYLIFNNFIIILNKDMRKYVSLGAAMMVGAVIGREKKSPQL